MFMKFSKWLQSRSNHLQVEDAQSINYLQQAADAIAKEVGDKTIVILGRDAWPLVPLLRRKGVKTQYFLYSRLQMGDQSTKEAWLREVPKGSYVLDTGYAGSIIDDIKQFDPSVKGILMSSSGRYPEIDVPGFDKYDRSRVVGNIEAFPKIIGRSKGFRGDMVDVNKRTVGDYDVDDMAHDLKNVIAGNEKALKDLGLSDDEIQQYKTFSGIPLRQRIGHTNFLTHYMDVDRTRRKEWDRDMREKIKRDKEAAKGSPDERFERLLDDIVSGKKPAEWDSAEWSRRAKGHYLDWQTKRRFVKMAEEQLARYQEIARDYEHEMKQIPSWDKESHEALNNQFEDAQKIVSILRKFITSFRRKNYMSGSYGGGYGSTW